MNPLDEWDIVTVESAETGICHNDVFGIKLKNIEFQRSLKLWRFSGSKTRSYPLKLPSWALLFFNFLAVLLVLDFNWKIE